MLPAPSVAPHASVTFFWCSLNCMVCAAALQDDDPLSILDRLQSYKQTAGAAPAHRCSMPPARAPCVCAHTSRSCFVREVYAALSVGVSGPVCGAAFKCDVSTLGGARRGSHSQLVAT